MAAQHTSNPNPVPAMTHHEPLKQPVVVISPHFLAQYPIDLTINGKVWTLGENDFDVLDVNGTPIFKIKSKLLSLHDRRKLLDASGNVLVTFKQKLLTMHYRWHCYRGDSTDEKDLLFTVKKQKFFQMRTQLDVFLAGNNDKNIPDFHIKGSYMDSHCTIFLGNSDQTILAQMNRRHDVKSFLTGSDKFMVNVFPNVDYAFITALVVILDEINDDRSGAD